MGVLKWLCVIYTADAFHYLLNSDKYNNVKTKQKPAYNLSCLFSDQHHQVFTKMKWKSNGVGTCLKNNSPRTG